eukprot:1877159-Alexandrium_andersonii.AAC.1
MSASLVGSEMCIRDSNIRPLQFSLAKGSVDQATSCVFRPVTTGGRRVYDPEACFGDAGEGVRSQ